MKNIVTANAYLLLGIEISASQKDILKRSKEIISLLKIDDIPEYDTDLGIVQNFRKEDEVKNAQQDLSDARKRILNYFFWFDIQDNIDEKAIEYIKVRDYQNAIKTWRNHQENDNIKSFSYRKNLAILYCLLLLTQSNNGEDYVKRFSRVMEINN